MILKLIGIEVLKEHGIEEMERQEIAGQIEAKYIDAVAAMFVEVEPGEKRPFKLDTENDSFPRESTHKGPADVSSTSAGTFSAGI